jgi:hypothetical protein
VSDLKFGFSPEGKFKRQLTDKVHNGLKCYEIVDGEVTGVAFVKSPANGVMGKTVSDERMEIAGAFLVADKLIYRINPITGEEYYIYFTSDSIGKIFKKFREKYWSEKEKETMFRMYINGEPMHKIAQTLDRTIENIQNQLNLPERFQIDLIRMSKMKMSTKEMAEAFGITTSELHELIAQTGGKIVPRNS